MDAIDKAIIEQLGADGRMSNTELAARVGLTPAPCLRRVQRLEADGVITGYRAIIDPARTGRGFEVIVNADIAAMDRATVDRFERTVAAFDEVVEFRRMFGLRDYFIRVAVADQDAFEQFLVTKMFSLPGIAKIDSHLTMKVLKERT
ncbi:Lrp/AsnC family transcriptional regulator [Stackebrandtia soli]|uniref:Lrp/AsnC family transcriptional regulator n=1 Tax=Stackebrandtia soli TaxID=1892856 RepID=UPI0039E9F63F